MKPRHFLCMANPYSYIKNTPIVIINPCPKAC